MKKTTEKIKSGDGKYVPWEDVATLKSKRDSVREAMETAKGTATAPVAVEEAQTVLAMLDANPTDMDLRARVKAAIRAVVSEIWVRVYDMAQTCLEPMDSMRACIVQVFLTNGMAYEILLGKGIAAANRTARPVVPTCDLRHHGASVRHHEML